MRIFLGELWQIISEGGKSVEKIKYYENENRTREERENRTPKMTPNNERKGAGAR